MNINVTTLPFFAMMLAGYLRLSLYMAFITSRDTVVSRDKFTIYIIYIV